MIGHLQRKNDERVLESRPKLFIRIFHCREIEGMFSFDPQSEWAGTAGCIPNDER